jgi:hypothetical protein
MRSVMNYVVLLLLVGVCVATAKYSSAQSSARQQSSRLFLYKVVHVNNLVGSAKPDAVVSALEKSLNDLGGNGWELCHEINGALVFKREQ